MSMTPRMLPVLSATSRPTFPSATVPPTHLPRRLRAAGRRLHSGPARSPGRWQLRGRVGPVAPARLSTAGWPRETSRRGSAVGPAESPGSRVTSMRRSRRAPVGRRPSGLPTSPPRRWPSMLRRSLLPPIEPPTRSPRSRHRSGPCGRAARARGHRFLSVARTDRVAVRTRPARSRASPPAHPGVRPSRCSRTTSVFSRGWPPPHSRSTAASGRWPRPSCSVHPIAGISPARATAARMRKRRRRSNGGSSSCRGRSCPTAAGASRGFPARRPRTSAASLRTPRRRGWPCSAFSAPATTTSVIAMPTRFAAGSDSCGRCRRPTAISTSNRTRHPHGPRDSTAMRSPRWRCARRSA